MLKDALTIARKEVADGLRDDRAIVSSVLYALMGPVVVGLVAMSPVAKSGSAASGQVLVAMMTVFTLVAAFVGGMSLAMDTIAGERERRSLLPLLLNPVSRLNVACGKWLAVSLFSIGGFALNLAGFAVVFAMSRSAILASWRQYVPVILFGLLPLPLLAASLQLLVSTVCRAIKDAQTYLSMLVFLPMGIGMFIVFFPVSSQAWFRFLPVVGQQMQLESVLGGGGIPVLQPMILGCATLFFSILMLLLAGNRMTRDEIIFGS